MSVQRMTFQQSRKLAVALLEVEGHSLKILGKSYRILIWCLENWKMLHGKCRPSFLTQHHHSPCVPMLKLLPYRFKFKVPRKPDVRAPYLSFVSVPDAYFSIPILY